MTPDGCSDHRSQLTQCTTYPNGITQSTRFLCYITVRQQGDCRHYIQPCLLSTNIVTTRMLIKIVSLLNVKRCDRKLDRCLPVSNDVAIAYHGPWSRGAAWAPASSYPCFQSASQNPSAEHQLILEHCINSDGCPKGNPEDFQKQFPEG